MPRNQDRWGVQDRPAPDGRAVGLSSAEARERLLRDGPNLLGAPRRRRWFDTLREVLLEPMFLLLLCAGALYLTLGELTDALVLMAAVVLVIAITFLQERRTERALEALRDLASPRACVVRDGMAQRVAARDLVVGDIVVLEEGDRVPADALLREANLLRVDESLLTGESAPVDKRADREAYALTPPGGAQPEGSASLFAGTLVVAGHGIGEVMRTGAHSEFGRIGEALGSISTGPTPLMRQMRRVVRWMAALGLLACAAVAVAYALSRGGDAQAWRDGGLAGIAMAMGLLPEEFPVVLTVFLALGAWRLSQRKVLTRRLPAIETLGAASVLCVDKTGTLTVNRMSVAAVVPAPDSGADDAAVLHAACRASRVQTADPMDRALHARVSAAHAGSCASESPATMLHAYPMTPQRLALVQVWAGQGDALALARTAAAKGAPEAIAALCRLAGPQLQCMQREVQMLAARGLRVLAVAQAGLGPQASLPPEPEALDFQWLGLVAFADPLRDEVPQAVRECAQAGIRVVMITGDYPLTALAIAQAAGIADPARLMTGAELDMLDDVALAARIGEVSVFARVVPQQKLRIVQAFKARGEVVAMTGDGVNDAPALKAAHIGIAMGARGSDVAREAASLVLLDDAFGAIVEAVRQGRRIHANIRRAVVFIMAVHVPVAGLSVLPLFTPGAPLLLLPIHIALLELIIDPSCTLVLEAEPADDDVMRVPPRAVDATLFAASTVTLAVLQGLSVLTACVVVNLLARPDHAPDAVRGLSFATLLVGVLMLILVNRQRRGPAGAALWFVVGATLGVLAALLTVPALGTLFRVAPLHGGDLAMALCAGLSCLAWVPVFRRWRRRTPQ